MKNQILELKKMLIITVQKEIISLDKTQIEIAKTLGVQKTFVSNFMNNNEAGLKGLGIQKLISMANSLDMKVQVSVKKTKPNKKN